MSSSGIDDEEARLRSGGSATAHLVSDLRSVLSDEEMCDVTLRGTDGGTVPAVRVLLAARSPVFRRMFFGHFLESTSDVADVGYPTPVVRHVVEFCCTADVSLPRCASASSSSSSSSSPVASSSSPSSSLGGGGGVGGEAHGRRRRPSAEETEVALRNLVVLVAAGAYYEINGLANRVLRHIFDIVRRWKPLACVVFDEALAGGAPTEEVARLAVAVIRRMPEFILLSSHNSDVGGGLGTLGDRAMCEIVADDKMQCDEATVFHVLRKWAVAGSGHSTGFGGGGSIGAGGRKKRRRGQLTEREVVKSSSDGGGVDAPPCESSSSWGSGSGSGGRESRAKELMRELDLSKVAPRFLSETVGPSGLVSTETLLEAYKSQAMRAAEGVDISGTFAQFRSKRTRMVIVLGAGVTRVNGVYAQDSPHRYSKPGTWRGNDVVFLLSKIGSRWYIWIQSRGICFYCCIKSDGSLSPMWKTTTESEHYDDDDDSVGDCQHMGVEPAPAFVWSI